MPITEEIFALAEKLLEATAVKFATFREYCADLMKYQSETHPEFRNEQIAVTSAV